MKGRLLISICNWTPPLSIHAIYFCWLRKDWNKWFKETWLGLQSNDPKIILTFDDKVHYFTKKKSEISTEWKFLKGRPPIYIFERACPALMHAHNSIKNQTEDIFKRHDVTHSEKDLTIRWWCNCIHCFMKRNRKYQLHDNPSVGGLEHTFTQVSEYVHVLTTLYYSPENQNDSAPFTIYQLDVYAQWGAKEEFY